MTPYKIHPLNDRNTPKELMGKLAEKIGDVYIQYPGPTNDNDPLGQRGFAIVPDGFDLKTFWENHPALQTTLPEEPSRG